MTRRVRPAAMPDLGADRQPALGAGDFSAWLHAARRALRDGGEQPVPCGECTACCRSSYFIHVAPTESAVLARIPAGLLAPAPGRARGHAVMGYDPTGACPMLRNDSCSVYAQRPHTCRAYDCRIFAAAGLAAGGGDKAAVNERVARWQFSYPTPRDRDEHRAVRATAAFVQDHPHLFPGGRVPADPSQLALLAIKAYEVFLSAADRSRPRPGGSALADAVVEAVRRFDASVAPAGP